MKYTVYPLITVVQLTIFASVGASVSAATVDDVLSEYQQQGAGSPQSKNGEVLWTREFSSVKSPKLRSCSSCHTTDLRRSGKHVKTNKAIDPMAPSINVDRLTDVKKIAKWFKRNCKWTLGRECTPQEKADVISFIRSQ